MMNSKAENKIEEIILAGEIKNEKPDIEEEFESEENYQLLSDPDGEPKSLESFLEIKVKVKDGPKRIEDETEDDDSISKGFECPHCSYKTNYYVNLKEHFIIHKDLKLYKCTECKYESNKKSNLQAHMLIHTNTKMFKCSECDHEFTLKGNLKRHLLTHAKVKLFKCPHCDYECNQKFNLKVHLLSHSNTKLFKCTECDYGCNYRKDLSRHLLTHTNIKLFKCNDCDYECNQKGVLKQHQLIHTEKKLFKCSQCDYECNYRHSLRQHSLTHRNGKMFKCVKCDYECNHRWSLKRHFKRQHSLESDLLSSSESLDMSNEMFEQFVDANERNPEHEAECPVEFVAIKQEPRNDDVDLNASNVSYPHPEEEFCITSADNFENLGIKKEQNIEETS